MRAHHHTNPVLRLKYMLLECGQVNLESNLKRFLEKDWKILYTFLDGYQGWLDRLRRPDVCWCAAFHYHVMSHHGTNWRKHVQAGYCQKIKVLLLWASRTNGNYAWKLTAALPLLFSPSPPLSGLWAAGTTGRDSTSQQAAESQMSGVLTKGNTPAPVI